MTRSSAADVRSMILMCVEAALDAQGLTAGELTDDVDLRAAGLVDSLGFVQLLADMEGRLGYAIDLADMDPEELTVLGPLAAHIAQNGADRPPLG